MNKKKKSVMMILLTIVNLMVGSYSIFLTLSDQAQSSAVPQFSFPRIIVSLVIVIGVCLIEIISIQFYKQHGGLYAFFLQKAQQGQKVDRIIPLLLIIIFFSWISLNIPADRFPESLRGFWTQGFSLRLVTLNFFCLMGMIYLFFNENTFRRFIQILKPSLKRNKLSFIIIFLLTFILLMAFRLNQVEGFVDHFFWNVAGTPVLLEYVYISIFLCILYIWGEYRCKTLQKLRDIHFFLVIFIIAAVVFVFLPINKNFFILPPSPPTNDYQPFSDARKYDLAGQAFINGFGVNRGIETDKPFYEMYLGVLRSIARNDYIQTARINAVITALIPALFYLIGKEIHNRRFGIFFAIFGIFYEITTLRSSGNISNVHMKVLMPEPIAGVIAAGITYTMIKWHQSEKDFWMAFSGILIGLGSYIRPQIIFFLLGIPFIVLVDNQKNILDRFRTVMISFLSFCFITIPWAIYCQLQYSYFPLIGKFFYIVFDRYQKITFTGNTIQKIASINPPISADINHPLRLFSGSVVRIFAHFLNNIYKSLLILPYSFQLDGIPSMFNDTIYWDENLNKYWDGSVSIIFCFFLALFLIGVVELVKKKRKSGIIPLLLFLLYAFALGISRTSGGRYIIPIAWIIVMYFLYGMYVSVEKIIRFAIPYIFAEPLGKINPSHKTQKSIPAYLPMLFAFIIGLSFPFFDNLLSKKRGSIITRNEAIQLAAQPSIMEAIPVPEDQWKHFISSDALHYAYGKLLLPVFSPNLESMKFGFLEKKSPANSASIPLDENQLRKIDMNEIYFMIACQGETLFDIFPIVLYDVRRDEALVSGANVPLCFP